MYNPFNIMRNFTVKTLFVLFSLLLFFPFQSTGDDKYSVGMDFIRVVDLSQHEGMYNLFVQVALNEKSSYVIGLSNSSESTMIDGAYKRYFDKYHESTYFQVGSVLDYDMDEGDILFGFNLVLGHEKKWDIWFAKGIIGFGIKVTTGLENPGTTNKSELLFQPVLNLIINF